METVYCTLTARGIELGGGSERAAGAPRRVTPVRPPRAAAGAHGGNVVDLAAWKAAREAEARLEDREEECPDRGPAPRDTRRAGWERIAAAAGELLSTLAVLAVAAALLVRILTF